MPPKRPDPLDGSKKNHPFTAILSGAVIAATVGLAILLRLQDPLSTSALPGQDPFRHMGFTRDFLRDGSIGEYPPGLHALMASLWAFTGADLYQTFRYSPVMFGAVGVTGMAVLLWRHVGPIPSIVGSLGYAVLPGFIKFTTKLTPTAVDLALTPVLFFAVLEIVHGRPRWSVVAAPITFWFVLGHPWYFGLIAAAILLFIVLCLIFPGSRIDERSLSPAGLAVVIALFAGAFGLMMTTMGGLTRNVEDLLPSFIQHRHAPWAIVAGSMLPLAMVLSFPRFFKRVLDRRSERRLSFESRLAFSVTIIIAFGAITALAIQRGLPQWVDLPGRFGWPALVLGAFGFVFLPFLASRLGLLAAAFTVVTYPLSMLDVYDISWLPFRVSFFFGIGLILLVGVSVREIAVASTHMAVRIHRGIGSPNATHVAALVLPAGLVIGALGGAVYVTAPEHDTWYRLHGECEVDAIRETAALLNQEPDALILAGSWQGERVLRGFVEDRSRLWEGAWWFRDYDTHRHHTIQKQEKIGAPLYLLVDPHTQENRSFLHEPPWQVRDAWCPDEDAGHRVTLYTSGPMYTSCQVEAIERAGRIANQDPDSLVLTGSWQAKTMVDAYMDDPSRAWIGDWFMKHGPDARLETMQEQEDDDAALHVLLDPFTHHYVPQDALLFLHEPPWQEQEVSCSGPDGPTISLYSYRPATS